MSKEKAGLAAGRCSWHARPTHVWKAFNAHEDTRNKCLTSSNRCLTSNNKKLLGAPGIATRNKDATGMFAAVQQMCLNIWKDRSTRVALEGDKSWFLWTKYCNYVIAQYKKTKNSVIYLVWLSLSTSAGHHLLHLDASHTNTPRAPQRANSASTTSACVMTSKKLQLDSVTHIGSSWGRKKSTPNCFLLLVAMHFLLVASCNCFWSCKNCSWTNHKSTPIHLHGILVSWVL